MSIAESLLASRVALFEKAKELSAGRVERALLIFGPVGDERSTFVIEVTGVYQHCKEKNLHRYLVEFDVR
jgi:hypothetical protein